MKLTKHDIENLTQEDLKNLRIEQLHYLENGQVLLNALLKIPFKKPEKVEALVDNIKLYNYNIYLIDEEINKNTFNVSGLYISSKTVSNKFNIVYSEITIISILDGYNNNFTIKIIDDVFQSVLGEYYVIDIDSRYIPISKIVGFEDQDSKIYKWYDKMCLNFNREKKLNRIFDDEDI